MSRSYRMQVRVHGFRPDYQAAIQAAAETQWDFDTWWEYEGWLCSCQDSALSGGETEEQFADELAQTIWRANQAYCRVEVWATYIESLPHETHLRDEASYELLMGEAVAPETEPAPGGFVLYDFDQRQLISTTVYPDYAAATSDAERLNDVLIVPLDIPRAKPPEPKEYDPDDSDLERSDLEEIGLKDGDSTEICDCERPGHFCSGIPGILAPMDAGRVTPLAKIERCDLCQRYPSDEAARDKLKELRLL